MGSAEGLSKEGCTDNTDGSMEMVLPDPLATELENVEESCPEAEEDTEALGARIFRCGITIRAECIPSSCARPVFRCDTVK